MLLNPQQGVREYADEASREMMLAVIDFFESKGLARVKHDDHERVWYQDFLEFVKEKRLFYACLTPPEYGEQSCRWDTWRNCELNEILGFYGLAVRDIRALPKLEGTVHVNMALVIKFMKSYFFNPVASGEFPDIPEVRDPRHDTFLFDQGPTRGLGKIRFHDGGQVYNRVSLANVNIFKKQIRTFKHLLIAARPNKEQIKDIDFLLILGELFTLVVYGQLILENAPAHSVGDDMLDQIFDFLVRDFSKFALQLYSKTSSTSRQRFFCRRMIRKPVVDHGRFERVWKEHVYALRGAYRMSE